MVALHKNWHDPCRTIFENTEAGASKKTCLTVIVVNGKIPSRLPGVAFAGDGHPVEDGVAGVQLLDLMRRKCFAALPALDLDGGFRTRLRLRWFDDRVFGLNRTLDGLELP